MASFALRALRSELFAPLFDLDDVALGARNMERILVEGAHSHPCRVSLADAAIGEQVLLLSHTHQPANSPYHASGRSSFVGVSPRRSACRIRFQTPSCAG